MLDVRRFVFLSLFLACMACQVVTPTPVTAAPADAAARYDAAARDWRTLLKDDKRNGLREHWLKLENRFLDVAKRDPKGDTGAKAMYQAGRCREELAKRSHAVGDWQQAVNHFLALAKNYPKHNLADDGLYQAAAIMARNLKRPDNARATAQAVLDKYPRSDMAPEARKLLAALPRAGATQAKTDPAPKPPSQPPAAGPGTGAAKPPAPPARTTLQAVICRGTSKRSTVILELDGPTAYTHQYLAPAGKNPARLVIDLEGVTLGPQIKAATSPSGMTVRRIRTSAGSPANKKAARVVVELDKVGHYSVGSGSSPPGIHIEVSVAADLPGGLAPPAEGKNGPQRGGRYAGSPGGRPGTIMEQLGLTVKTVMIDAGHGGKDPGAMGHGIRESAVTLTLSRMLGERLKKKGYTVLYTRDKDRYVTLEQRPILANDKKADLFISLHVNASKDKKTNGLETYFMDLARTSGAASVAARENAVSVKSVSDLQFILADLMLSTKLQESQDLAAVIHHSMFSRVRTAGFTVNDNGVRSAPFYVLMGARMPAVLVEIGYLTNDDDARRIKSPKYLERLADGIANGVDEYKIKLSRFSR